MTWKSDAESTKTATISNAEYPNALPSSLAANAAHLRRKSRRHPSI
jgi:hypothetical protein